MNLKSRLNKLNKILNAELQLMDKYKGLRPRTLEDYFSGTLEGTYIPEQKKGGKKLEDFLIKRR